MRSGPRVEPTKRCMDEQTDTHMDKLRGDFIVIQPTVPCSFFIVYGWLVHTYILRSILRLKESKKSHWLGQRKKTVNCAFNKLSYNDIPFLKNAHTLTYKAASPKLKRQQCCGMNLTFAVTMQVQCFLGSLQIRPHISKRVSVRPSVRLSVTRSFKS